MLFIVVCLSIFFWLSGLLGSIILLNLELFWQFLTTIRLKLKRAETRYMFLPLVRPGCQSSNHFMEDLRAIEQY
jgi:hypothetical protein